MASVADTALNHHSLTHSDWNSPLSVTSALIQQDEVWCWHCQQSLSSSSLLSAVCSTRRDQSVFNRCRIGHSRLTHEFLLKGEPPPECIPCNCPLTIKHLLIECVDFIDVRQRFYQVLYRTFLRPLNQR